MIIEVGLLMERFNHLESLLSDFGKLSGQLSSADLELTDETQEILDARDKIIKDINELRPLITELIDKQPPEKAAVIRKMLIGETVLSDFSDDEKAVQGKIINLRSLQSDIMQKECGNRLRFQRKHAEIREELENLQREKKKLNFYQNTAVSEKGAKFDNQS